VNIFMKMIILSDQKIMKHLHISAYNFCEDQQHGSTFRAFAAQNRLLNTRDEFVLDSCRRIEKLLSKNTFAKFFAQIRIYDVITNYKMCL